MWVADWSGDRLYAFDMTTKARDSDKDFDALGAARNTNPGGIGLLLIQMAKMRGATVITTVSTEEKAELARGAGADHVVLYMQDDFHEAVMRITDGAGCQVAYDSVGLEG